MPVRQRLVWGITGSVAAIRAAAIAETLRESFEVRPVATSAGMKFIKLAQPPWPADLTILQDDDEWNAWNQLGDPVLHIELRNWADALLIAPMSADALAKLATGQADSLLLSVARAWDFSRPFVVAPAMNTLMLQHPVTDEHLHRLQTWGVKVVPPVSKELACGDTGLGALADRHALLSALLT